MRIRLTLAILLNGDHRGKTWTRDSGTRYENRAATTKGNLHVPGHFVKGNLHREYPSFRRRLSTKPESNNGCKSELVIISRTKALSAMNEAPQFLSQSRALLRHYNIYLLESRGPFCACAVHILQIFCDISNTTGPIEFKLATQGR